jgi:hypothetical protein
LIFALSRLEIRLPSLSRTPGVSVRKIIFFALSATAILLAAKSALM